MAKKENLYDEIEQAYEKARTEEANKLHNDLVAVIHEHKAELANTLFVLDLIRFQLMDAKYKEIMGVVRLTDEPPIKKPKS